MMLKPVSCLQSLQNCSMEISICSKIKKKTQQKKPCWFCEHLDPNKEIVAESSILILISTYSVFSQSGLS